MRDGSNTRILGVDSSTTGVAWTLMEIKDGRPFPVKSGKINLTSKKEMFDKMEIVGTEFPKLIAVLQPHHVFVEKSIFVKNPDSARKLSMVVGGLMMICAVDGFPLTLVEPASWKSFTQYRNLTRKMVESATEKLGKTEGKKFCDRMRKVQTSRVLQHCYPDWDLPYDDNDIIDSAGIALYGVDKIAVPIKLDAPRIELVTQEEIDILGG